MKKFLCLLLTAAMLFTLASAFAVTGAAEQTYVVRNASPAITATAGVKIDLGSYRVVFDGDSADSAVDSWKLDGTEITEFTPGAKGVTALTAVSGGKTKTVYVVAKAADEDEYVLFEDDFTNYSSVSEVTAAGYKVLPGATIDLKDGALEFGDIKDAYAARRLILPEWLGEFGDYRFVSEVKISAVYNNDNGRWFGPVIRSLNNNDKYYPYYHCCIRKNTTSSGLEFGGRNVNDGWSVMLKRSGMISDMSAAYHRLDFSAFGDTFQLLIDGEEMFYTTQDELKSISSSSLLWTKIDKGYLGFVTGGSKILIDRVKVVVQENAITRPPVEIDLINIAHDETPIQNPLANVRKLTGADAYKTVTGAPSQIFVDASEVSDFADLFTNAIENSRIANVKVSTNAQVDALVAGAGSAKCKDVSVVSSDASVLKYVRAKNSLFRTGLIVDLPNDKLSSKEAEAVRKAVRGAPATFCVIGTEHATTYNVHELQALALAVWVEADAKDDSDMIKAVTSGANAIITEDNARLTAVLNQYFAANTLSRVPILIGHRGNPTQAPENSLASFRTAMENGADVFEIDVEITKDNHIVVMHDNTIDRTTNGSGSVNSLTLEQIKSYNLIYDVPIGSHKAGEISDQKVPTLEEVLDLLKEFPNCRMFIEFKGNNANNIPATSKIVKAYGMEDRVDVISFNANFLTQTQQPANMPGMSTGLLGSTGDASANFESALKNFFDAMRIAQLYNSTINNSGVSYRPFMTVANDRGMTVWPWTYTLGSNNSAFFVGAAGITTNDVQWAKDMYKFVTVDPVYAKSGVTVDLKAVASTFSGGEKALRGSDLIVSVISGGDIVSVANGKVTALKDGEAKLLVGVSTKSKSGTAYVLYAQPVDVRVGASNGVVAAPSGGYTVDEENLLITRVLENTDEATFASKLSNAYDCKVAGTVKGRIATGTTVECAGKKYTVIVKGDVNGDGLISATDYAMVKRCVIKTYTLNANQALAADVSGDGAIKAGDYAMLKRHVLKTYVIK